MTIVNTSNINFNAMPFDVAIPEGDNRFVIAMAAGLGISDLPTVVSVASTTMTLYVNSGGDRQAWIWGAVIPNSIAAGNYALTVTGGGVSRWWTSVFTGVSIDPVVDIGTYNDKGGGITGASTEIDTYSNGWVEDIFYLDDNWNSYGAGQTAIDGTASRPGVTYKTAPVTLGTVTMSWTGIGSYVAHAVISLRPAKVGGSIIIF